MPRPKANESHNGIVTVEIVSAELIQVVVSKCFFLA